MKKRGKKTTGKRIFLIAAVVTIIGGLISIVRIFIPTPVERLAKSSEKAIIAIEQKQNKKSLDILDTIPSKVISIQKAIDELSLSLSVTNKYINHIREISDNKYLKSLSTTDLLLLAQSEYLNACKISNDIILKDVHQNIMPFLSEENKVILDMHEKKMTKTAEKLIANQEKWKQEHAKIDSLMVEYAKTMDVEKNNVKPDRNLYKLCKSSIFTKGKEEFLQSWIELVPMVINYLTDLEEYYIKNATSN